MVCASLAFLRGLTVDPLFPPRNVQGSRGNFFFIAEGEEKAGESKSVLTQAVYLLQARPALRWYEAMSRYGELTKRLLLV